MTRVRPKTRSLAAVVILAAMISPGRAIGDDPPRADPAVRIRLARPDAQLRELIALFRGARAAHPAAALAAWKRASDEPKRLGKPLEAAIAALNPNMIPELRTLDDARFAFAFDSTTARLAWRGFLPHDDGTFSALASAFVLTDGAAESPFDEIPVDRLGPPGSPLMARGPDALLIAPDRPGLDLARRDSLRGPSLPASDGISALVEPGTFRNLAGSKSLNARRLAAAFGGEQAPPLIDAWATLGNSDLSATLLATFDRPVANRATVDPAWLDWTPRDRAALAFALAIEPGAAGWTSTFALVDRVERVDPARAGLAPSRLRLGLAARAAGIRIEADLIPYLKGVSGWVGPADSGFLALHINDEAAATRLVEQVRFPDAARRLPDFSLTREGPTVLIAWGRSALVESREAHSQPDRSAWPAVGARSCLLARAWPGRVAGLAPQGSPLALALLEARPITWRGSWGKEDEIRVDAAWPGLDAPIRRFLERIPLDPPPDR